MRILGIDPGLNVTGYGVIEAGDGLLGLVEAGAVETDDAAPMEERLAEIFRGVGSVISSLHPDIVAVEELYSHYAHPRTAILMGHARGAIFLAAALQGLGVVGYSANRVKKALTGSGHASKEQVGRMVQSIFGLDEPPSPNDVSDALAIAACHCLAQGYVRAVNL